MSIRPYLGAAVLLSLLIAAGCQNSSAPTTQTSMSSVPQQAVVISGGNSGSGTVIFIPTSNPDEPMMMSTSGANCEVCPECKAAAIKYFRTGVLDPKCSRTGATRTAAVLVTPNVGHQ